MALNRVLGEILTSLAWLLVKPADQASRADRYWKFAEVEADDEATLFEMVGSANDAASLRRRIDAEVVADARELFPKGLSRLDAVQEHRCPRQSSRAFLDA